MTECDPALTAEGCGYGFCYNRKGPFIIIQGMPLIHIDAYEEEKHTAPYI